MTKQCLVYLLVAVVVLMPGPLRADSDHDYATGHVNNWGGSNIDLDFSARSNFNGTQARGYARFDFRTLDAVVTGDVTCLVVVGGVATIGGVITNVRGSFATGNAFVISATDSGKFSNAPDTVGMFTALLIPPATLTAGAPCAFNTFEIPVTEGDIVVYDALS